MLRILLTIFMLPITLFAQDFGVGSWREHLPYDNVTHVVPVGHRCYAATPYSMYYVDTEDQSVNRLNTITGLTELGISLIHPNEKNNTVVVGYSSGNIDIIKEDNIINISAIINSNVVGDRTIYGMHSNENYTYIATGFGIVVLDVLNEEIKDTYIIGNNGSQLKVNDITIGNDTIYAATDDGLRIASLSEPFLSDPSVWSEITIATATANVFQLVAFSSLTNDRLFVVEKGPAFSDDVVHLFENSSWSIPAALTNNDVYAIELNGENLIISRNSDATEYDISFNEIVSLNTYKGEHLLAPNQTVWGQDYYWLADRKNGLMKMKTSWNGDHYPITGPYNNEAFHLACDQQQLWVSAGRVDGTNWNNTFNWHGAYHFDQQNWETYNQITVSEFAFVIDSVTDILWSTIDPSDKDHVFLSSFRGGLIELQNGQWLNRHTYYNSSLQTRIGQGGNNVCIASTSFDNSGNLWVSNSFVNEPLSVYTADGDWMSFNCGSVASNQLCTDILVDPIYGYVWMAIKSVGLLVYDFNQTPTDISDDQYRILTTAEGNGKLPNNVVNTIVSDRDGEIWLGTEEGPAVIYNPYDIFSGNDFDAQQILLNLDGTVQLLLETEIINEILVDGGNRKWFATAGGGLFLMSEEGTEMIHAFNQDNSPLFSDNVLSLAMNHESGELYISTEKGIMGFKGTATEPGLQYADVYAYPNPVRPEYTGNIAIKGFTEDSEVKITDANGNLVFTTYSVGGQATWNGNTLSGNRVSSGIYYVFATSSDGSMKTKTKILFIQ